jgi:ATP-dependent Clp protease ATP-binding subunit ClpX
MNAIYASLQNVVRRLSRPRCSFCGETMTSERRFIAGPGVYICEECVARAQKMLADGQATASEERWW